MDAIHVVLAVYDPKGTYSRHAGVVMTSIFEHTKSSVCVHILHDETLTEHNCSLFKETADMYGQSVEFHDVSPFMRQMSEEALQQARKGHSFGALYRLLVPNILSLDKIIYLDCDVVVNMDIRELWDIVMGEYSIAGVLDANKIYGRFSFKAFQLKLMKCDRENYVNSGVLVMNLSRIREKHDLIQESIEWYKQYQHYAKHVDQNFINSRFCGDIKIIDGKFNNCHAHKGEVSDSILHAILATSKPWNEIRGSALDRLYWKAFLKSPFGRLESNEIADTMIDLIERSSLNHRHTSQCYGKIFSRFWKDIFCNDITMILWLCAKCAYYRIIAYSASKRGLQE
ncbi:hypothetical protein FACS1894204_11350 [Synergistales bacterium]|nr:hypothetical protein FACS1894204_11350 [Synergistales bacterium]